VNRTPGCRSVGGDQNTRLSLFDTVRANAQSNGLTRGRTFAIARELRG